MSLTLYFHPLSSFCQKALVALYENETPFTPHLVDLGDPAANTAFKKVWPVGKFPVLHDSARNRTIPESSIIIEYLDRHYPGRTPLVPADPDLAIETRQQDRFFDLYVNVPVGKIVTDRLRPAGRSDPHGVEEARALLRVALDLPEQRMAANTWAVGERFTMADCAAAPALFYADIVLPFRDTHPNVARYLARLLERPSFARATREAQPYLRLMPQERAHEDA
jgi:glutathione S-transferase